jgi:mono/diheme cytochrome c family protein
MNSATNRFVAIGIIVAVLLCPVGDMRAGEPALDEIERGKRLFAIYCGNCHGDQARGDGPTASILEVAPTDLTVLSKGNGGEFPTEAVVGVIDGREKVRGHGSRDMPIWGLAFQEWGSDANQEEEVQRKVRRLIAYLESIQRE